MFFKCNSAATLAVFIILALFTACSTQVIEEHPTYVIGLITNNNNGLRNIEGFKAGMAEFGYIEGENTTYIFDGTSTDPALLDETIQNMIDAKADLIFTAGTPTGVAAHRLTANTDVPVVFGVIADPIAAGVMSNLTHPGGNLTGVMLSQNQGLRLELLHELVPNIVHVFVPYDPNDTASTSAVDQITEIAPQLGLEIVEGTAHTNDEVTAMLQNFPQDIDAIFLVPGTTVNERLSELVRIAQERKLPLSGPSTAQVEEGALMTYGFVHHETGVQAARIADNILKGADPGEIPVEFAEFFFAINLQIAEAIEIEISNDMLQRANIIIREDE